MEHRLDIMSHLNLASTEFAQKKRVTRREKFLDEMNQLVPFAQLETLIEPHYPANGYGGPTIGVLVMLRLHFLAHWFGLSDDGLEDAIYDSQSMRDFLGLDLSRHDVPDATTLLKFRNLLKDKKLIERLFAYVNARLSARGLLLREGTTVDAALIAVPNSTASCSVIPEETSKPALTPLVELRRVIKHYQLGESRITALKGIDLTIYPGEFVAVWGPSGSGKSTLCNVIGLLDVPSSGTVHFNGLDAGALSDNQRSEARNRAIGFIFQGFNLIPVLSALENVMLPIQLGKASSQSSRRAAVKRLADVGLSTHMAHRPAKLSGGQQQRVAIARALISSPALVVADEPTANLDSENALKVINLMRQISKNEGTTFVFSTHDERLLERVDRRIMMRDGELIEDGDQALHPHSAPQVVSC